MHDGGKTVFITYLNNQTEAEIIRFIKREDSVEAYCFVMEYDESCADGFGYKVNAVVGGEFFLRIELLR